MWKIVDIPPTWLALALAIVWWQPRLVPFGPEPGGLAKGVGGALVAIGIGLIVAAALEFARHRTTIIPHQTPARLVQRGVFALSRNPIYLGDAVLLTGCAIRWGAWLGLICVPVFVWWVGRHFITAEEDRMRQVFGATYSAYTRKVRRWL
jgi:protein-S-isoprenylcysteine O-methyltransferase Ste14